MSIQHSLITDPNIHEPKGAASATSGTIYTSDGLGSGTWQKVDSLSIKGLAGDGGDSNLELVTDGTEGYVLKTRAVYGSMVITGNTNAFAMTAAVDSTLNTNSDYVLFTGTGAPWAASGLEFGGLAFSVDRLTIPTTGVYKIDLWSTITGFPTNTAKISVKYRVNGGAFSTRHPIVKSNSSGDAGNLNGFGLISLNAGDYIQLYLASTATGGLTFLDVNTTLNLIRAT